MDAKHACFAVDLVGLHLRDVVGHIVNQAHAQLLRRQLENFHERLPRQVQQELAIGPGIVRGRTHGAQIPLAFVGVHRRADELAVGQLDAVLGRRMAQVFERVFANLVAEAARAGVNKDRYGAQLQPEHLGRVRIHDFVDYLYLEKMIAAAERADLVVAAFIGVVGDEIGPRAFQLAAGFGALDVLVGAVAAFHHVWRAFDDQLYHFAACELYLAGAAHAAGHGGKERVDQLFQARPAVFGGDVGAHQAHAAIDVVPHAAGADYAAFLRVGGRDAANAEAVAPVDIRHGERGADDARQRGDVGDLLG